MSQLDRSEYLGFAQKLALAAAGEIIPLFGNAGMTVESKRDATPVTVADRNAEARMREMIGERFPAHGIVGEEFGEDRPDEEFVWVLDPIDGTKSFITGVPLFTTLVALKYRGKPMIGAIYQPVLNEMVLGDGKRATFNGEPVRARDCRSIDKATLLFSEVEASVAGQHAGGWARLQSAARFCRTWGDGYGYARVATGFAHIMADPVLEQWDKAALLPVLEGAGVVATDWNGGPAMEGRSLVAAVPGLHAEVLALLNE